MPAAPTRPAGRAPAAAGRRSWARLVFQSTTSTPPSSLGEHRVDPAPDHLPAEDQREGRLHLDLRTGRRTALPRTARSAPGGRRRRRPPRRPGRCSSSGSTSSSWRLCSTCCLDPGVEPRTEPGSREGWPGMGRASSRRTCPGPHAARPGRWPRGSRGAAPRRHRPIRARASSSSRSISRSQLPRRRPLRVELAASRPVSSGSSSAAARSRHSPGQPPRASAGPRACAGPRARACPLRGLQRVRRLLLRDRRPFRQRAGQLARSTSPSRNDRAVSWYGEGPHGVFRLRAPAVRRHGELVAGHG